MLAILNRITPEAQILTRGTSQNNAFVWLVSDDAAMVCPEDELDVIQRYVLAVNYYSLGGNRWDMCNARSSPTVSPCPGGIRHLSKANVCAWFNVTCAADGANVVGVFLGTFFFLFINLFIEMQSITVSPSFLLDRR
jgi:hypothetical protein